MAHYSNSTDGKEPSPSSVLKRRLHRHVHAHLFCLCSVFIFSRPDADATLLITAALSRALISSVNTILQLINEWISCPLELCLSP